MKNALKLPSEFIRLEAKPGGEGNPDSKVDRTGGRYGAGLIRGVSLCSVGEALGHGFWIDAEFLQQIVDLSPEMMKSRFTHPSLCADGTGKALGSIDNQSVAGEKTIGDLHFTKTSHKTPSGDLATYVMGLAEETPQDFGLSIVFKHDMAAIEEFALANGGRIVETEYGREIIDFKSPDPRNVQNLLHARILMMRAADVVDSPAANPDGLFHRPDELLSDAGELLDFVLGQSAAVPALSSALGLNVAPERIREFVSKRLADAGLSVVKGTDMAKVKGKPDSALAEDDKEKKDPPPAEGQPEGEKKDPPPADPKKEEAAGDPPPVEEEEDDEDEAGDMEKKSACSDPAKADLAKFCETFGHEAGAKYFLAGTSLTDALSAHVKAQDKTIKEQGEKLAAFAKSGVEPVGFGAAKDPKRDKSNPATAGGEDGSELTTGREKIAAALADKSEA